MSSSSELSPFGVSLKQLHDLEVTTIVPSYQHVSSTIKKEIDTHLYPRWTSYEYVTVQGKVADKIKEGEALYIEIDNATQKSFSELAAITIQQKALRDFKIRRTTLHGDSQVSVTNLLPPKTQTTG